MGADLTLAQPEIAVVLTCNRNYLLPTFATALSARRHITIARCLIKILVVDADEAWAKRFQSVACGQGISIIAAELPELAEIAKYHRDRYLPPITLARFWLERFLEPSIERFLYLDGDTLVDDNLDGLLTLPIPNDGIMAAPDSVQLSINEHSSNRGRELAYLNGIGIEPKSYFNAGVILASRDGWAEIATTAAAFLVRHPDLCRSSDQSALNYASKGRLELLPLRYNYQSEHIMVFDPRREGMKTAIWHFTGGPKPWDVPGWPWDASFNTIYNEVVELFEGLDVSTPKSPAIQTEAGLAHRRRARNRLTWVYPWRIFTRRNIIKAQFATIAAPRIETPPVLHDAGTVFRLGPHHLRHS